MSIVKIVETDIPSKNHEHLNINAYHSLADADIVVFSPNIINLIQIKGGKPDKLIDSELSKQIENYYNHWENELRIFLSRGGTLLINLIEKQTFSLDISHTSYGQKVTSLRDNYHMFFPFGKVSYEKIIGKKMVVKSDLVTDLYNRFKDILTFEVCLKCYGENVIPLFKTKNDDRILGASMVFLEGNVILLPKINFNKTYDGWTDEDYKEGEVFINTIIQIHKSLKKNVKKTPNPIWINNYELIHSQKTQSEIFKLQEKIYEYEIQVKQFENELEENESLKDLLFETGTLLEKAVIKALKILGYQAENYNDGTLELDQIILSPEGDRFIGECEGKESSAIDISKFRQLLENLNADFEREEVKEKAIGLLFGNPQRFMNPEERILDFTEKCKKGAERDKIGLIKTSDLFTVCKIIQENDDDQYAKECREAIKNQIGKIIQFPDYKKSGKNS